MRKYAVILFCQLMAIVLSAPSAAQKHYGSAYAESVCGAMSCERGLQSVGHNPAGTAWCGYGIGAGYISRMGLSEVSEKRAMAAAPLGRCVLSAEYQYYGFSLYNESRALLGCAMPIAGNLSAGIDISYMRLHISGSPEKSHAMAGGAGLLYEVSGQLMAGLWVSNFTNSQYSNSDTILPASIHCGISCHAIQGCAINMDVEKSTMSREIVMHGAAVFQLMGFMSAMAGVSSHPLTLGMGMEFRISSLAMQFAASRNEHLGWTPSASVIWQINKSKKSVPE